MSKPEPSCYLFVATDIRLFDETIDSITAIEQRLEKGYWALDGRAPHRRELEPDDKILIYAGGSAKYKIVAKATLASGSVQPSYREKGDLEGEHDYIFGARYGVRLKEIELLDKPVPIKPILRDLSFVGPANKWGIYFRRAVIKITEADYNMILETAKSLEQ